MRLLAAKIIPVLPSPSQGSTHRFRRGQPIDWSVLAHIPSQSSLKSCGGALGIHRRSRLLTIPGMLYLLRITHGENFLQGFKAKNGIFAEHSPIARCSPPERPHHCHPNPHLTLKRESRIAFRSNHAETVRARALPWQPESGSWAGHCTRAGRAPVGGLGWVRRSAPFRNRALDPRRQKLTRNPFFAPNQPADHADHAEAQCKEEFLRPSASSAGVTESSTQSSTGTTSFSTVWLLCLSG